MILHAIWFGSKTLPLEVIDCIDSWKKFIPTCEIKIWTEETYNSESKFFQSAIKNKMWAYASDYARFDILNRFGGIYIDTDMLVLKSMDTFINNHKFFIGKENDCELSCGIIALPKNHIVSIFILDILDKIDLEKYSTIPLVLNDVYLNHPDFFDGIKILDKDYFYPYPFNAVGHYTNYIKSNSFAVHLWNASWKNYFERALLRKKKGDIIGALIEIIKASKTKPWRLIYLIKLIWK